MRRCTAWGGRHANRDEPRFTAASPTPGLQLPRFGVHCRPPHIIIIIISCCRWHRWHQHQQQYSTLHKSLSQNFLFNLQPETHRGTERPPIPSAEAAASSLSPAAGAAVDVAGTGQHVFNAAQAQQQQCMTTCRRAHPIRCYKYGAKVR